MRAKLIWLLPVMVMVFGCATTRVEYREVKVPVPVPCAVETSERPSYADEPLAIRNALDLLERVRLMLAGREQRDQYIRELEAATFGCRPSPGDGAPAPNAPLHSMPAP